MRALLRPTGRGVLVDRLWGHFGEGGWKGEGDVRGER